MPNIFQLSHNADTQAPLRHCKLPQTCSLTTDRHTPGFLKYLLAQACDL